MNWKVVAIDGKPRKDGKYLTIIETTKGRRLFNELSFTTNQKIIDMICELRCNKYILSRDRWRGTFYIKGSDDEFANDYYNFLDSKVIAWCELTI